MSKIVLLSRNIKHTTWPLAVSLQAQQHQVYLITDRKAEIDNVSGIEVLSYFKNWSLLEALRILPTLLAINPQIFHLVLEKDEISKAEILLSYMAQSFPRCIVTTSLLDLRKGIRENHWIKSLVEKSDVVTFPSLEAWGHLRGLNIRNRRQNRGLMPPLVGLPAKLNPSFEHSGEIKAWIRQRSTLAMPLISEQDINSKEIGELLQRLAVKYHLLFLGTFKEWSLSARKKWTHRLKKLGIHWIVSETVNYSQGQKLIESCEGLWLAGLPLSPIEYTENLWMSWGARVPVVIDLTQASMHAGLWQDSVNSHIIKTQSWKQDLDKLLSKRSLELPNLLSPQTSRSLLDNSTNDLSRLYNKALSEKAVY